ncbi:MAG: glycosyltransferase family 9 protein [Sporomusaceae bacterium]|nr:glycosyltransferase family 9 protein [Sporomusaceae bacterium]
MTESGRPQNILVVKMSAIGDVIHAMPVAYAIKETYPNSHLTWVVETGCRELIEHNPYVDEIISFPKKDFRSLPGLIRNIPPLKAKLTARPYDVALDLQGLFKSAVIVYLSKAKAAFGFCNMREGSSLISRPVCGAHQQGHVMERYLDVARAIGCKVENVRFPLEIQPEEQERAEKIAIAAGFSLDVPYVLLTLGANWPNKRWPAKHLAAVSDWLSLQGVAPVYIGGPGDQPLLEAVKSFANRPFFDITGKTSLIELAALILKARVFLGGDTGPMHLAAGLGTPVIGLFGPTDTNRNGPYGAGHRTHVIALDCAGCWQRSCPKHLDCLAQISPEAVMESFRILLAQDREGKA